VVAHGTREDTGPENTAPDKKPRQRIHASFRRLLRAIERQERWWRGLSDADREAAPDSLKEWFANVLIHQGRRDK